MRALKFLVLLTTLTLLTSCAQINPSVVAQKKIAGNDHEALARYYEKLSKDTKVKLQESKKVLEEYEAHPYYYGRKGQDLQSHTSANIRAYEKTLKESLKYADLHRRMVIEQSNNQINKAESDQDIDFKTE